MSSTAGRQGLGKQAVALRADDVLRQEGDVLEPVEVHPAGSHRTTGFQHFAVIIRLAPGVVQQLLEARFMDRLEPRRGSLN